MKNYRGIDVSFYQGDVDFAAVKRSGIDFVMIKATQGRTAEYDAPFADPKFAENASAAGAAGLYYGAYHYLCARNLAEAEAEARYFARTVKPYSGAMKLWCAVDVEDGTYLGMHTKAELSRIVARFCDIVAAEGLRPMVYASTYWLDSRFDAPAGIPIWEANWSVSARPSRARMWQKTSAGRVSGIDGDVDVNEAYGIIGDANGDGKIDIKDALLAMRAAAGWNVTIDEGQADVNDDGYVTVADAVAIMKIAAGR